jgi:hypothetical protein
MGPEVPPAVAEGSDFWGNPPRNPITALVSIKVLGDSPKIRQSGIMDAANSRARFGEHSRQVARVCRPSGPNDLTALRRAPAWTYARSHTHVQSGSNAIRRASLSRAIVVAASSPRRRSTLLVEYPHLLSKAPNRRPAPPREPSRAHDWIDAPPFPVGRAWRGAHNWAGFIDSHRD